jgi:hypothetical protein
MKSIALWRMKREAKRSGLRVAGNFLIAFHARDVISGFTLDPAPSSTYIWTFVIPTYDDLPCLHMSLGQRIAGAAADLLLYVDSLDFTSDHSEWVKYISAIRLGDFVAADATLKTLLKLPMSNAIKSRLDAILSVLKNGSESGAQHLLETWSVQTDRLVGGSSWGSGR